MDRRQESMVVFKMTKQIKKSLFSRSMLVGTIFLISLGFLGCDDWFHAKRRKHYHYPVTGQYGLKILGALNYIHENFIFGESRDVTLNYSEQNHFTHKHGGSSFVIRNRTSNPPEYEYYYFRSVVVNSPFQTLSVAAAVGSATSQQDPEGLDVISFDSFSIVADSIFTFTELEMTRPLPTPFDQHTFFTRSGRDHIVEKTFLSGTFYPLSIGLNEASPSPISLAYYPQGDFVGFFPVGSAVADLSVEEKFLSSDKLFLVCGGYDEDTDTLEGAIELDGVRFGTFTITNLLSGESELIFELEDVFFEVDADGNGDNGDGNGDNGDGNGDNGDGNGDNGDGNGDNGGGNGDNGDGNGDNGDGNGDNGGDDDDGDDDGDDDDDDDGDDDDDDGNGNGNNGNNGHHGDGNSGNGNGNEEDHGNDNNDGHHEKGNDDDD